VDYSGDLHSIGIDSILDAIATDEEFAVAEVKELWDCTTALRESLESFGRSEDSLD
jgi:hypothetical protein